MLCDLEESASRTRAESHRLVSVGCELGSMCGGSVTINGGCAFFSHAILRKKFGHTEPVDGRLGKTASSKIDDGLGFAASYWDLLIFLSYVNQTLKQTSPKQKQKSANTKHSIHISFQTPLK